MKFDLPISFGESGNHGGNKSVDERPGAPDPQFSHRRIGQERDLLHASSQIIEHGGAAIEQYSAIDRCLDALGGPIEETDAERMLQVGNCFRYDRLRDGQLLRRPSHTSSLYE